MSSDTERAAIWAKLGKRSSWTKWPQAPRLTRRFISQPRHRTGVVLTRRPRLAGWPATALASMQQTRRPHAPGFASKSVLYGTGNCSACGMWSEGPHQIDPGSWVRRSFRAAFAQASLRPCVLPWRDDGFCHSPMAAAFTPFEGDHHLRPEFGLVLPVGANAGPQSVQEWRNI